MDSTSSPKEKLGTSRMLNPLTQAEIESLQREMQQDGAKVRAWLQEKEKTEQRV
ncbi:hypothetical protein [uncultured Alcanivorax sp.]|jgi:hypothetical protein|uniref:hypothetical protein n=1 Tax=uncultured Alcanivorax sp. TaxID=191215 RepID=UPI00261A3B03|nr:hypothetical protein [uncultured Alcanivorax sp.]